MNTQCANCGKILKLSGKMLESIETLEPGKSIRVKCPKCSQIMVLDRSVLKQPSQHDVASSPRKKQEEGIRPPEPPDISWLETGSFSEDQVIEDIPQVLLLMERTDALKPIERSFENLGYRIVFAEDAKDAIEKMQFTEYAAVVYHEGFGNTSLEDSPFHAYMCHMEMSRRRFLFYVLVGGSFKTFYHLQALASSANLVVNDREISHFDLILRKAIPEYEELFGPITEELRVHGR